MNKKIMGSILMILGTCVGAGMLALPVVSAEQNIWMTLLLLFAAWFIMTIGAFALLEVNLSLPSQTNLVSMSKTTLGNWGRVVTWLVYLILLYSLICAYLSGTSGVMQTLLAYIHINIPRSAATLIAMAILVIIVYRGIGSVDIVNRGLMSIKLLAYLFLVIAIAPHINIQHIMQGNSVWSNSVFMVMITSFGYAIIIPSLRDYLKNDQRIIKKVVMVGSLIPLVLYILWIAVVQGLLPRSGNHGLVSMITSENTNSSLMLSINTFIHNAFISDVTNLFISICAITSFLGVSICLVDFVADGLQINKNSTKGIWVYVISFLPPLLIVLLKPGVFIEALTYAGIWCVVLLIVLPLLMLYSSRHHTKLATNKIIPGGKPILILALLVAAVLLIYQFIIYSNFL
jgi:tyrosine-specific transport protein